MTIWKYPLEITDEQNIRMPKGANILTAQIQGGTLCLWAIVDPKAPLVSRWIGIVGTGHPMAQEMECVYLGTAQMAGGALVWHVFELEPL